MNRMRWVTVFFAVLFFGGYYVLFVRADAGTDGRPEYLSDIDTGIDNDKLAKEILEKRKRMADADYRRALTFLKDKRFTEGVFYLRSFVRKYGSDDRTEEANQTLAKMSTEYEKAGVQREELGARWEARNAYSVAYLAAKDRDRKRLLREKLETLNYHLLFGPRPSQDAEFVTIWPGDSFKKLQASHNVPAPFIKKINKIDGNVLRSGSRLKIPKGTFSVLVSKGDFQMHILLNGHLVRTYDIGTGRNDRTPESSFTIATKVPFPDWYASTGKVYKYGNEKNILGTRWLGFKNTNEYSGFGVHGTNEPQTIGTEASAGCIRMRNEEAEEIFDIIPRGTVVTIVA